MDALLETDRRRITGIERYAPRYVRAEIGAALLVANLFFVVASPSTKYSDRHDTHDDAEWFSRPYPAHSTREGLLDIGTSASSRERRGLGNLAGRPLSSR